MIDRAVLTIAAGAEIYREMALDLARSFLRWNGGPGIAFVLATDRDLVLPRDLAGRLHVVRFAPRDLGEGFANKLHIDALSPARCTLFLDADSLVLGPLGPVFDRFAGHAFSAVGRLVTAGDFFGDVAALRARFDLPALPQFVGGLYYMERGDVSSAVLGTARALAADYDALGLLRLRGQRNEEPLVAIGMALHGQSPLADDGSIKADAMHYQARMAVDVLRGAAHFHARPAELSQFPGRFPAEARPVVAHFNCRWAERSPYRSEVARLRKVARDGWPEWAATGYATIAHVLPERLREGTKSLLRPALAAMGLRRPVGKSRRMAPPGHAG